MRLNNLNENPQILLFQAKTAENQLNQSKNENQIIQIKINHPKQNVNFLFRNRVKIEQNAEKLSFLISQKMMKSKFSNVEVLGIILIKVLAYQTWYCGYSRLKLNILKSINQLQKQKILSLFQKDFLFKTSSHEMMTIFNCSIKMLLKKLTEQNGVETNSLQIRTKFQFQQICQIIHKTVLEHFKEYQITMSFFTVFLRMILTLVKYPRQRLQAGDYNSKQIYFIICDYLGCKILEKSSSQFLIENIHLIKQTQKQIQFGQCRFYCTKSKNTKIKTQGNQQNQQTRSTIDVNYKIQNQTPFHIDIKKQCSFFKLPDQRKTQWKYFSLNNNINKSYQLQKNQGLQKRHSRNQFIKKQDGHRNEKKNLIWNKLNLSQNITSVRHTLKKGASAKKVKNQTKNSKQKSFIEKHRNILNQNMRLSNKSGYLSPFRCFKCSNKKKLQFCQEVIGITISSTKQIIN